MKKLLYTFASLALIMAIGCQEPIVDNNNQTNAPTEEPTQKPEENPDDNQEEVKEEPELQFPGDILYEGHLENGFGYEEDMPEPSYEGLTHISFTESDEIFANPERGFYKHYDFTYAKSTPLSAKQLQADRINGITLCYTGHYLSAYRQSDIDEEFLNLVRTNMQALREGGAKCILRFAYSRDASDKNKAQWDAAPEYVQRHIQNLKPIIQEYSDVILCWQAGFVGVWGEWYYTNHFVFAPSTPEQHILRRGVIDAMLDALPADRTVALRTPMFKKNMYSGSYTDTLTVKTAYSGSDLSRLSCFNDCFGASKDDVGTFEGSATRKYWEGDSRYVLMGGETCGLSNYCTCENSLKDMEDYHWTYMNSGYNSDVLGRWTTDGCMDEVKRRLGYRLSLADAYYSAPAAGSEMQVALRIKNSGFAAPMNPRAVELVLVDGNGTKTVYELKDVDPRFWFANKTSVINQTIAIPAEAAGTCTLYLNLPDQKPTLHDNPDFAIRLANDNVWDAATGYNKILEFTL